MFGQIYTCGNLGWVQETGANVLPGPKRSAHFGASFRCLSRLKLNKTIVMNSSGDSALSAGCGSLSYLSLTAEACAVCDYVSPCRAHQRQAGRDGEAVTGPPEHVETDDDEQP